MAHKSEKNARDIRALLWLLPVLAVASWLVWEIARPRVNESSAQTAGSPTQTIASDSTTFNSTLPPKGGVDDFSEVKSTNNISQPFTFDPNTVDYHSLVRLGFSRGEALGIIKYRERGKVFEIPEDFAACYQVSEAMYRRLQPYINIGEEFRLKKFAPRKSGGENGQNLYESTEQTRQSNAPQNIAPLLVELNSADTTALVSVKGIGSLTAGRIVEYRTRLGGFVRPEQLAEVRGVTEQNYERIVTQIFVDAAAIKKIDINFASAKQLAAHPYIGSQALRKLLKQRQLKGGWRTVEELEMDDIFTTEELARLDPYLLFN
jgi:DNA uptake protein ComE-like DNA-binding protein